MSSDIRNPDSTLDTTNPLESKPTLNNLNRARPLTDSDPDISSAHHYPKSLSDHISPAKSLSTITRLGHDRSRNPFFQSLLPGRMDKNHESNSFRATDRSSTNTNNRPTSVYPKFPDDRDKYQPEERKSGSGNHMLSNKQSEISKSPYDDKQPKPAKDRGKQEDTTPHYRNQLGNAMGRKNSDLLEYSYSNGLSNDSVNTREAKHGTNQNTDQGKDTNQDTNQNANQDISQNENQGVRHNTNQDISQNTNQNKNQDIKKNTNQGISQDTMRDTNQNTKQDTNQSTKQDANQKKNQNANKNRNHNTNKSESRFKNLRKMLTSCFRAAGSCKSQSE
ncbi:hypothetical protein AMATHDRAFT_6541 [Amanita thiersii Skay4041]|uniref:Uncharacterized protein n=1 Tax=Amanita thiersii Skay4041 TaxID=703135 RepID=A0A2A9NIY0_9AGAR|nr:hypothetical protein AMATHDRAFT_6541 [Amanita thiersii Skay4041]